MPAKGSETKNEAEHIAPAQILEAIQRKSNGFKARDRELLAIQLDLERAGIRPEQTVSGPTARDFAASLLTGSAMPVEREPSEGEKLQAIIVERQALGMAIEALASSENRARITAAAEMVQSSATSWRAIVRRRVEALLELRRANAAAAQYRDEIRRIAKNNPTLICDAQSGLLFGPPIVGDASYVFLEACCKAGIVTRKEIQDAA